MTAVELDPVFLRALRLLHSKSKDSTNQLKCMLDDAIKHRKGLGPGPMGLSPSSPSDQQKRQLDYKRENEKRTIDRLKHELSELVIPNKKSRLGSPGFSSKSHTPSPTPTPPGFRGEGVGDRGHSGGSGGNSSEADEELNDLDINLEGLNDCTCCICKSFNQENGNKLMECHTCQNLYHQECHSPAVSNDEANDPRLVWNCSNCNRTMPSLKPVTQAKHLSTSSLSAVHKSATSARASPSKMLGSKGISSFKANSSPRSFRSGSSSSAGSAKLSSVSSSSSSVGSSGNSSSTAAIDKRLQQMIKKKTASRKLK